MSGEYDFEPIRGLPAHLPKGEVLLWQGAPDFRSLAMGAFQVRKVAIYFGLLIAYRLGSSLYDGVPLLGALKGALPLVGLGLAALAILGGIAFLVCLTTVYSITSRRVVMRIGVALSITFNIPFKVIESASLKLDRDGIGSIPLVLTGSNRLAYLIIWPHARPWRARKAEPALRYIPDAAKVAQILSQAVAAASPETIQISSPATAPVPAGDQASWPLAPAAA